MLMLAFLLQAADTPAPPLAPLQHITRVPCVPATNGDVVVCGGEPDRYRLPFPVERDPSTEAADTSRATAGSGMAAMTPAGRCGIFAGERRCGKAEAAGYGYGGGRDPITVVTRLATRLVDPDAELKADEPAGR